MASIYNMNTAEQFGLGQIIEFPSVKQEKAKKRSGKKSEVYNYQPDDLVKMMAYLEQTENWIHWLIVAVQCNTARRISDTLALRWSNIYNPATGNYRTEIEITEKKTGKVGTPAINDAVKQAIGRYISETNCDPSKDNYSHFVFEQLSGNFKGKVITPAGHRKALKKAAQAVGIEYNVGTHSARKTLIHSTANPDNLLPTIIAAKELPSGILALQKKRSTNTIRTSVRRLLKCWLEKWNCQKMESPLLRWRSVTCGTLLGLPMTFAMMA